MENEDGQSVCKNEIDSSTTQDSSKDTLKNLAVGKYENSCKLKTSLLKLTNLGMPEESGGGGAADNKEDLRESASAEKKINGEVAAAAAAAEESALPKENGANIEEEEDDMAPLSIDVEESVEGGRGGGEGAARQVESGLKRKLEDVQDSSSSEDDTHSSSPVEFRGFKKRMIAKAEKSLQRQRQISESESCSLIPDAVDDDDSCAVPETEKTRIPRSTVGDDSVSETENARVLRSTSDSNRVPEIENPKVLRSSVGGGGGGGGGGDDDVVTENKRVLRSNSVTIENSVAENTRALRSIPIKSSKVGSAGSGSNKEDSGDQLTEYAQYLGLQPTVKFKCYRCGEKNFQSMAALNEHQTSCSKPNVAAKPSSSPLTDSNSSTNFRITRKVYLCSACGTYYENWKLFLHMRDVHKRHICLYCLGMFAVADKLAEHLVLKHKIVYQSCNSPEEFLSISKGSGYLTCCSCERIFTERENFFDHQCRSAAVTNSSVCLTQAAATIQPDITVNRNSFMKVTKTAELTTLIKQSASSPAPGSRENPKRLTSLQTLMRPSTSILHQGTPPTTSLGVMPDSEFIDASSFCHVDIDDATTDSSRKNTPSSSMVKSPVIVLDSDSIEESDLVTSTKSPTTSKTKSIFKTFPMLKRISDLTQKGNIDSGTFGEGNKHDLEKSGKQMKIVSVSKNEKQSLDKKSLRTKCSDNIIDSNSDRDKKKLRMKEKFAESSSSDNDSTSLNLAKKNETTSRTENSIEDDSDSNDVTKNTAFSDNSSDISEHFSKKKQSSSRKAGSRSGIDRSGIVLAHSPLFMEVVNESDNESLESQEKITNQDVSAPDSVHSDTEVDEGRTEAEIDKNSIEEEEIVVKEKRKEVNDEKEEAKEKRKEAVSNDEKEDEVNRDRNEEVDRDEKEEEVDRERKEEEQQEVEVSRQGKEDKVNKDKTVKEDEANKVNENDDGSLTTNDPPVEKDLDKNSVSPIANVVSNGPSTNSQENISSCEDTDKEDESDDHFSKDIDKNNLENKSDDKLSKDSDENNEEDNKLGDNISKDSDENNEEDDKLDDNLSKDSDKNNDSSDENNDHSENMDKTVEEENKSKQNGVTETADNLSENNKLFNDQDDKSIDSDDSDKLSVVLSEASSDESSKSGNDNAEKKTDTKSIDDNAGHFESTADNESQPNQSEEILNGENDESETHKVDSAMETSFSFEGETLQIASKEVMAMALTLEDKMESLSAQSVIKECIRTSCTTCGYCNHAVKIGVNGKQLAAHLLAEHRYKPVKNETVEDVIERLKQALSELQDVWFNTDSYDSSDKSCFVPFDHTYECFQCNYVTKLLKDLINHKRKVHQKTILYCSMCKANFYSYSELLCHMCPGVYVSEDIQFRCCFCEIDRIPSAFRLMVHLRKSHHTCDVCLEIPGDQQKLSTHMWKHKLHHICYRCGIAYRNKPDITKHLFWKHGTESVLCKKCLQKKWPHVYHFCIPPTVFICEECNISFSKAVALKVHKRIHAGDCPYSCTECSKKFVSRKILDKHVQSHREPIVQEEINKDETPAVTNRSEECDAEMPNASQTCENRESEHVDGDHKDLTANKKQEQSEEHSSKSHKKKNKKDRDKKNKPVVDVYDLPPLNLSSESDDSDDEKNSTKTNDNTTAASMNSKSSSGLLPTESSGEPTQLADTSDKDNHSLVEQRDESDSNVNSAMLTEKPTESSETLNTSEDNLQSAPVIDGIWDNFHSYKAEQEKRECSDPNSKPPRLPYPLSALPDSVSTSIILGDHDYCFAERSEEPTNQEKEVESSSTTQPTPTEHSSSMDHDYCTVNSSRGGSGEQSVSHTESKSPCTTTPKKKQKSPKKSEKHNSSSSSDSSSDSDSSSCSNSNCSCCSSGSGSSSSSSSDSDSSSSEGKRQTVGKRDRKKEKTKSKKKDDSTTAAAAPVQEEEPVVDLPVEPEEPPIRESDLETDESSTEEDFYDEYPQRHANQMLAEKRNQLLVLATVAPVNNGISSPPSTTHAQAEEPPPTPISAPAVLESTSLVEEAVTPVSQHKPSPVQRRGRKKRKRGGQAKNRNNSSPATQFTYDSQPSTSFSQLPIARTPTTTTSTPVSQAQYSTTPNQINSTPATGRKKARSSVDTADSTKRLSKRRRVPNKFYGYSSDEEEEMQHAQRPSPATVAAKWRRVESVPPLVLSPQPQPQQQPPTPDYNARVSRPLVKNSYQDEVTQHYTSEVRRPPPPPPPPAAAAVSSSAAGSSSSSASSGSESDSESDMPDPIAPPPAVVLNPPTEKDEKLYCYCQCPYDEVSEMIACDGSDCTIEWFHFECVGIMVPPKGKWYCPDCDRRRKNLL